MAKKANTTGRHHTRKRAKEVVADGTAVRNRVRQLSVEMLRDRNLSLSDIRKLVHDVLEGAVEGVEKSIPASKESVLREVFDGLSEGVHAVATAGSATVSGVRERGRAIAGKSLPAATKRISAANEEFLGAVRSFADTTSKQVRGELDALVDRAEKTGPKVASSARRAAKAADGRLVELSDETARAGARVVRRAAGALAMGASGLLEGMAQAIAPKGRPAAAKRGKTSGRSAKKSPATKTTPKKVSKKVSKATGKKKKTSAKRGA